MALKKEVSISIVEKAREKLSALPAKEPTSKPLDKALSDLKPVIEAMLRKGYTRAEVCTHLNEQGIPAREYHLKALLSRPRTAKKAT